ncbi:endonuclease/exonuclease/phosphatase family protein [Streptomyces sp. NPDC046821]|uniref:endonuclease/exonuclease/phosphatase family protein n=1 Tax=Streptomyces sp. NPDC046821 TaxID=3154702 RepID=UPI0033C7F70E
MSWRPDRWAERRAALGALCLLFGAAAPTSPRAAAPQVVATYRVWQWNVAGNAVHHGSTTDGLVEAAAASLVHRRIDLASFNELCYGQFQRIRDELTARHWPVDPRNFGRFEPSLPSGDPAVCQGDAYGIAVFSRQPLGTADRWTLPDDRRREKRKLLCAPVTGGPRIRLCTTHITVSRDTGPGGVPDDVAQLTYVLDRAERYHAAGDTVVLAGDFNAQPDDARLNAYYTSSAGTGHYREIDDNDPDHCPGYGEGTVDVEPEAAPSCGGKAKIDMIFVREDVLSAHDGDSLAIPTSCAGSRPCSDHRVLTGTVTVTVDRPKDGGPGPRARR